MGNNSVEKWLWTKARLIRRFISLVVEASTNLSGYGVYQALDQSTGEYSAASTDQNRRTIPVENLKLFWDLLPNCVIK